MSAAELADLDKLEEIEDRTGALTAEVAERPMDAETLARLQREADELLSEIRELRASLR